ncbi:Aldehyde/histidinol dehydrogenase [Sporodiniella umbellata]|nr:Aldehyde/histidinol dehydrogenase [Sporodiniella umbellata]
MSCTPLESIPKIIQGLKNTFKTGMTKDLNFRKSQLKSLKHFIEENQQHLLDAVEQDLNKSKAETIMMEISVALAEVSYMLKNIRKLSRPRKIKGYFLISYLDEKVHQKEPKGVVLIFSPWNYPVRSSANLASLTILPKYLDPKIFSIIAGGSEESRYLLKENFDHIFFTGSKRIAKEVMAAAAKHLTPVTLELGGKSPAIIADDADIWVAARRILWGKMSNAGQTCVAPDYVMLPKRKMVEFVDICHRELISRYGEAPQKSKYYGRIGSESHFNRLSNLLEELDNNKILIGGQKIKEDLYIAPTLVGPLTADYPLLMQEEIFGPILPIVPVDDIAEAIEIVNQKESPLVIYLFTEKKSIYKKVRENTKSGAIMVNDTICYAMEPEMPFGGVGASGIGSYHGPNSFSTFSYERALVKRSSGWETIQSTRYPPMNMDKERLISTLCIGLSKSLPSKTKEAAAFLLSLYRVISKKDK